MLFFSLSKFYQRSLELRGEGYFYYFISFTKEFLLLVALDCKHKVKLQALKSLVLFPGAQKVTWNKHSKEQLVKSCYLLLYTSTDYYYLFFSSRITLSYKEV